MTGIDTLGLMLTMAFVLPIMGVIGSHYFWQRTEGSTAAKLLVVLGIMCLLVPGTCFAVTIGGEALHLTTSNHR